MPCRSYGAQRCFLRVIAINMQPLWGINTTPRMSFETASAETPLRPVSILNEW